MTRVIHSRNELATWLDGRRTAWVPTMGALHEGHAANVRSATAAAEGRPIVVSVFVNPRQFGVGEDLDWYPRTLDDDVALCRELGVDVVFAPSVDEVYRGGSVVTVDPGPLGDVFEGRTRPGHFTGVLTVVLKLANVTRADLMTFGEKDFQQCQLVTAMVRDLDLPVRIVRVPTVRERDGLALSSRNRFLTADEREQATDIPRALEIGIAAATEGKSADQVVAEVTAALRATEIDYVAVVDDGLLPATQGDARLLIATKVGTTRLLDNAAVVLSPPR